MVRAVAWLLRLINQGKSDTKLSCEILVNKLLVGAGQGKSARYRKISKVVKEHGYSQMEVARHLKLHYSTISRLIKNVAEQQR
jgi:DNA-directed RNA polymerase specialized sigma subunit